MERHVLASRPSSSSIPAPRACQATILQQVGDVGGAGGEPCAVLLGIEMDLKRRSRVTIIEDGVILCQESPELGAPGVVALLSAEGLSKDISGFQVVKNEAYHRRIEELRGHVRKMVLGLREQAHHVPLRQEVLARLPY